MSEDAEGSTRYAIQCGGRAGRLTQGQADAFGSAWGLTSYGQLSWIYPRVLRVGVEHGITVLYRVDQRC